MKNPEMFLKAISTMLHSWGSDTPPEALWALTEFVEWLNAEYDLELEEIGEGSYYLENDFETKMEVIEEAVRGLNVKENN